MAVIVSKVRLFVPIPSAPVQRIIDKWANKLKDEALAIFQKLQLRIPDETKFKNILAEVSSKAYQPLINPVFVSRAGTSRDRIVANQANNLLRSYDKWIKKLTHIFETVDTVEAARFKEAVDLMKTNFAEGVANRTLPFTGTKIEGRSAATIAGLWLVDDVRTSGLIRPSDKVDVGVPYRICRKADVPGLKAGLQWRVIQAGASIVKANHLPAAFTEENNRTNEIVDGFRDPALLIEAFTTGGDSHVDYILGPADQLFLEVQVAVTP